MDRRLSFALQVLPPAIVLVLTGVCLRDIGGPVLGPPLLFPLLQSLFAGALPLLVAVLAAWSYVDRGAGVFLLLFCGLLAPLPGNVLAAWGMRAFGLNLSVTIHNTGWLLGGAFHLAGAGLLTLGSARRLVPPRFRLVLRAAGAGCAVAVFIAVLSVLAARGLTPVFFRPTLGGTVLRQAVLATAATCYALSATILLGIQGRTGLVFLSLHATALFLCSIGLGGALAVQSAGSPLAWVSRAAVYAGNLFFVLAVVFGRRETGARGTSIPAYLTDLFRATLEGRVQERTSSLLALNRRLEAEIEDRRRVEAQLRRSEERLRHAGESTGFGVFEIDHATGEGFTTPETRTIFGLSPDEPLPHGDDWVPTMTRPADADLVRQAVAAATDPLGSGVLDVEFRVVRRDGETRWVRVRSRTTFEARGKAPVPVRTNGIIQDVTERRRTAQKILESEQLYRSILDKSLQGMAIIQDGRFVLCNETLCRMSGYSRMECYRMAPDEVAATIHPADRQGALDGMRRILEADQPSPAQVVRMLTRDGRTRWVEVLATRTSHEGRPALQVSYLDVTAQKRAEEAYRTLVDTAQDGLAIIRDGRALFANQALTRITGYTVEEMLARSEEENRALVHPDDLHKFPPRQGSPGPVATFQSFRIRHRDGTWRDVEAQIHPVEYEGEPAVQVAYRDVSEVKAAQDALDQVHRKMRNLASHLLRAREEERRNVAQEIHDELGQILAALKMDLHWLKKRVRGASDAVVAKVDSMINLGEQTIAVVQRISSDLRPKMLDDLGLEPALEWLASEFQHRQQVTCTVHVDVPQGTIGGNAATILYRVVQEALSNVGRHSLARHARVSLQRTDGCIELRVEDDGIGITPAQGAAADSFGIIGMHERVEGLGGTVVVAGQPGEGTTVTARIPLPAEGGLA